MAERKCETCRREIKNESYLRLENWFLKKRKPVKDSHKYFCDEECLFQYLR